ncbi:hypothetical protein Tco_1556225 [Tanacetum coccineum]
MVACLERTYRNANFHEIMDFLTTSPIHHALIQIHATVDGKKVVISESSVRSDLYFNDEDEPFNDICKTRVHTKKVFTNMKRKGKDFSGRITPLFASMLAPPVVEGEGSGQPTESQPAPSTTQPIIEEQVPVTESSSPQNTQTPRQALQEDNQLPHTSVPIPNVADEAVFTEWDDRVEISSGDRPRCQEAMRGVIAQTRSEKASKHSYDSPLLGVNTPGSDEEIFKQHELMDNIPPTPHDSPLPGEGLEYDLKKKKKLYATAFKKLINRGRYGQNLETQEGFGDGQEVSTATQEVSTASPQRNVDTTADELTLAETLIEIKKVLLKIRQKDREWLKCIKQLRVLQMLNEMIKKFFAQQRVEAKRNKPMTPAQQKDYMSNYIKNQEGGYSIKQLKSLSFEQVKEIFETTMRRVQSFMPMGSELEVQRLKRAESRIDIFMLVKKEYPLTRGILGLMMVARLLVEADSEMSRELLRKIFYQANRPRPGGLLGIRGFYNLMLLVQVCAAAEE